MISNKTRILIVEDEVLIAHQLRRKLEGLGYQVIGLATNGRDALRIASDDKPDLALMDIVIQGDMDGIETADALIKDHNIPVIYLTAYADDDTLRRAEDTRAYGYILKPFNEREVHAMIKMTLSRFDHDRGLKESLSTAGQLGKALEATLKKMALQVNRSDMPSLEKEMHPALQRGEFVMHFQPQVSLDTGRIIGAEALMRWHHPERGLLYPGKFIPLAEESGIIERLGEYALEQACQQMRQLQSRFGLPLKLSVNVSVRQLHEDGLAGRFARILTRTGFDPALLELEVTESMLLQDNTREVRPLLDLKALGLKLAIDDFGTGYSALAYLKKYPFDIVKIDRSFIRNISENGEYTPITTAILKMTRDLGLTSIAEGVETERELEFLRANRCDSMQGYLFSPALALEQFAGLLESDTRLNTPRG
jgi:EAL domain-containing protein (putative c-di-GMP-specific phosphodiesterase class I)/AmiR/NasT family two-component response regulator